MTIHGVLIDDWYSDADAPTIVRTVTSVPAAITKAWFTLKNTATDADPGVLQKAVTTTFQAGIGQITNDGAGGTAVFNFLIPKANIASLTVGKNYVYDIKVLLSGGSVPPAIELGYVRIHQSVTRATS